MGGGSANPAPLGLMGFALTTILLNLHNCGFFGLNSAIVGLGIAFGGVAQLIAGIMEFTVGNTFGTTAFCAYGSFWLSLVLTWILPEGNYAAATDNLAFGFYLLMWGLFSAGMTIATFKFNRAIQIVFISLTALFILLAITKFTHDPQVMEIISGSVGIFCGLSAFYLSIAEVINGVYAHDLLPIGNPPTKEQLLGDNTS
eukprot:Protomagalhaensia_sp_Gyna_25__5234@NODE_636_length_2949_cov_715_214089_g495_i0_p2_GENE_NODE_636_length_2949_cov_715_214089_g495_i0NODE_636_length_2949_cov_715_214089_g495_i0_p2_ORF_typecomplete_len200_score18_60Gpr1_Fun34_YaaH/PF01184_19/2_5e50SLATT_4/PF18186_1/0_092SID1_RNA_chan/PF13965_6/0_38DUF1430/PF07242_11/17DUF1430/PF07242_11/2_8e02DUF5592/PF17332_2/29DUF5592/PF17332_2/13_NODE_636_length_2949_cov_715_214089_g495_i08331432